VKREGEMGVRKRGGGGGWERGSGNGSEFLHIADNSRYYELQKA